MGDLHIDDFYRDVARVFAQLYGSFPRKQILLVEDIAGPDTPDEFGLHSQRHQACFSAFIWLAESGYISYIDTIYQEGIDQASLSHKALTLLSSRSPLPQETPQVASKEEPSERLQAEQQLSNISQIRQALKSGSSTQLQQVMQQLLLQARHFQ